MRPKESQYSIILDNIALRFRLLSLFYIIYLVAPMYTLIIFENALNNYLNAPQETMNNPELLNIVLKSFATYTITYVLSTILLVLNIFLVTRSIKQLATLLRKPKVAYWIYSMVIFLILVALIVNTYIIITLPRALELIKNVKRMSSNQGITDVMLRDLTLLQITLINLILIAIGITLRYITEKHELLEYLQTGASMLMIGGILELVERYVYGFGLGPIIIILGLLLLGRKRKIY